MTAGSSYAASSCSIQSGSGRRVVVDEGDDRPLGLGDAGVAGAGGAAGAQVVEDAYVGELVASAGQQPVVVVHDQDRLQRRHGLVRQRVHARHDVVPPVHRVGGNDDRDVGRARSGGVGPAHRGCPGRRGTWRTSRRGTSGRCTWRSRCRGGSARARWPRGRTCSPWAPTRGRAGGADVLAAPGTSDPSPTTNAPSSIRPSLAAQAPLWGSFRRFITPNGGFTRRHPPRRPSGPTRPGLRRTGWAGSACPAACTPAGPTGVGCRAYQEKTGTYGTQVVCLSAWVRYCARSSSGTALRPSAAPGAVAELRDVDRQRLVAVPGHHVVQPHEAGEVLVVEPERLALVALGRVHRVGRVVAAEGVRADHVEGARLETERARRPCRPSRGSRCRCWRDRR